jgi:hypothetical protein
MALRYFQLLCSWLTSNIQESDSIMFSVGLSKVPASYSLLRLVVFTRLFFATNLFDWHKKQQMSLFGALEVLKSQ